MKRFNHDYGVQHVKRQSDNIGRTGDLQQQEIDDSDWFIHRSKNSRERSLKVQMERLKEEAEEAKKGVHTRDYDKINAERNRKLRHIEVELEHMETDHFVGPWGRKSMNDSNDLGRDFHKTDKDPWAIQKTKDFSYLEDQEWAYGTESANPNAEHLHFKRERPFVIPVLIKDDFDHDTGDHEGGTHKVYIVDHLHYTIGCLKALIHKDHPGTPLSHIKLSCLTNKKIGQECHVYSIESADGPVIFTFSYEIQRAAQGRQGRRDPHEGRR